MDNFIVQEGSKEAFIDILDDLHPEMLSSEPIFTTTTTTGLEEPMAEIIKRSELMMVLGFGEVCPQS